MLNSLVREHRTESGPARIKNGLRHAGPSESCGAHVAHRDVVELPDDARRELVQEIAPSVGGLGVQLGGLALFAGTLRATEAIFNRSDVARVADLFPGREHGEVLQPKVDADCTNRRSCLGGRNLHGDIEKPVAAPVAREIRPVLDLAVWKLAGIENAKRVTGEAKGIAFALEIATLERNPSERTLAAPAQVGTLPLRAAFDVLLADGIDRPGVQAKFLAAAGREIVEVEPSVPTAAESQRVLLPLVAIVPDIIHRPRLFVQQAVETLDAVTVNDHHRYIVAQPPERTGRR